MIRNDDEVEKEKLPELKQWMLNILLPLVAVALVMLVLWIVPGTRIVPQIAGKVLVWIFKALVFLVIWLLMLLVPIVAGGFSRAGINALDVSVDRRKEMGVVLHIVSSIAFGFVVCVAWMYGIRLLVSLPTWVNAMYVSLGWLDGLREVLPWGWAIWSFISYVIGYFVSNSFLDSSN